MTVAQLNRAQELVEAQGIMASKKIIFTEWTNRPYITLRFMDIHGVVFDYIIYGDGNFERTNATD